MNTIRKKILIYTMLAMIFIMACNGCYSFPGTPRNAGDVSCLSRGIALGVEITYTCTCPLDSSYSDSTITGGNFDDPDFIKLKACAGYYAENSGNSLPAFFTPTPTPTATPTATPTEDPAFLDLNPYLTETFTTCDNVARYVNFPIAEDAPVYDPNTFKLLFNGQVAKCAPASTNPSVLTCNYPPAPDGPPAIIEVYIGDQLVNEFDFDGGEICNPPLKLQDPDFDDSEEEVPSDIEPTATETEPPALD